ncbi:MAG: V-type ATP synthase subunit D [Halorientalis sp.]
MSRNRKPTRTNLREVRDRIELAERGHDILERKRDAMILEFMDVLDEYEAKGDELVEAYTRAQDRESRVRSMEGGVALEGIARARTTHPTITVTSRNVMGVAVPTIQADRISVPVEEHGYGLLGTSPVIDEVVDAYEDLLELIITVADLESTVKCLLAEIKQTTRRVNAIEHAVLPDLRADRDRIRRHLNEKEREAIVLRKWIKDTKHESRRDRGRDGSDSARPSDPSPADSAQSSPSRPDRPE